MSKYYMVYLKYVNLCMVCKKVPFTRNLYKEIVTDKIIYPQNKNTNDKLTYDYLPNGLPHCYEISKCEVSDWLYNLNVEGYMYKLGSLERIIKNRSKFEMSEKRIFKSEEKEADKTIKRTLIKIKNR